MTNIQGYRTSLLTIPQSLESLVDPGDAGPASVVPPGSSDIALLDGLTWVMIMDLVAVAAWRPGGLAAWRPN
jgi:hypothetical protein